MSIEEFRFLNPAHNKPVIKASGTETIVLPIDKIAVFQPISRPTSGRWCRGGLHREAQRKPEQIAAKPA